MAKVNGSDLVASSVLVILGGSGDLAMRMLLPSLYHLDVSKLLPENLRIIGVARSAVSTKDYRVKTLAAISGRESIDDAAWARFEARLDFVPCDVTTAEGAGKLASHVGDYDSLVIYFSVSPSLFGAGCKALGSAGLTDKRTRLVLEKPIGRDLKSSQATNDIVAKVAHEEQIFRIDHYLGKETVQNLIALRFGNVAFEPLWTNKTIDHVQITVSETEGVGARWPYYDEYGAVRDMLQNHMLQLLCLIAMEPPSDLDADSVRMEKVKVLRSLRPFTRSTVLLDSVRGQYGPGIVEGKEVSGYEEEVGRPSGTETFVGLRCDIDNWRWAGVPFFLRTGKRMPERQTRIVVKFKALPHSIFGTASADLVANQLVIDLQPQEDISLLLMNQRPGLAQEGMRLQSMPLSLSLSKAYTGVGGLKRIAYERLLLDVFRGDQTLFVHRDEVEQAWRWIDGIEAAWDDAAMVPKPYAAGSAGTRWYLCLDRAVGSAVGRLISA